MNIRNGAKPLLGIVSVVLGIAAAVGIFTLVNWLRIQVSVPLTVVGWIITGIVIFHIFACFMAYLGMRKDPNASMTAAYLYCSMLLLLLLTVLGLLALFQQHQGTVREAAFAHLMAEGFVAFAAGYGLHQAEYRLSDFLPRAGDEISDTLDAFAWMRSLIDYCCLALLITLLALEMMRPALR